MTLANDFQVALIDPRVCSRLLEQLAQTTDGLVGLPTNLVDLPRVAIVHGPSGLPAWEVSLFLCEVAIRSGSIHGDSVRTYAEALLPWLRYLQKKRLTLEEVDEEVHGLYRASVSRARKSDGEPYASATVNLRVTVPELLHSWGERRGVFSSPLGVYLLETNAAEYSAWAGAARNGGRPHRRRPKIRVIKRLPQALSREEIHLVLCAASMPLRLMFKWAVATGLRRMEICSLRRSMLPRPEQIALNQDGLMTINFLRKGSRELPVYVPTALLEETNWYVLVERARPVESADSGLVFLSPAGTPISRQSLSRGFRKAADQVGSSATMHHTRHTFAVNVLAELERRGVEAEELNPLKTLQILLGHAHSETSEIYTQAASFRNEVVATAFDALFER